jgi:hypothetical protein
MCVHTGDDQPPAALRPVLVYRQYSLVRELVSPGELLGHGGLDQPVGEREAAFERQGLGDL